MLSLSRDSREELRLEFKSQSVPTEMNKLSTNQIFHLPRVLFGLDLEIDDSWQSSSVSIS